MSLIVVEGIDGSGKTTLLRTLREQSKTYFWIASSSRRPPTVNAINDAVHWLGQCVYLGRFPVVCDRFPLISEAIYGPVLRESSLLDNIDKRQQRSYTEFFQEIDRIVYCRPPKEVIKKNLQALPQMDGVIKHFDKLLSRYDAFMNSLRDENIRVYPFDYTRDSPAALDQLFFGRI